MNLLGLVSRERAWRVVKSAATSIYAVGAGIMMLVNALMGVGVGHNIATASGVSTTDLLLPLAFPVGSLLFLVGASIWYRERPSYQVIHRQAVMTIGVAVLPVAAGVLATLTTSLASAVLLLVALLVPVLLGVDLLIDIPVFTPFVDGEYLPVEVSA